MPYQHVEVPGDGAKVTVRDGKLQVPDRPIVPFIEGDGTGPDIWRASVRVFDAAVAKAYGGRRRIACSIGDRWTHSSMKSSERSNSDCAIS